MVGPRSDAVRSGDRRVTRLAHRCRCHVGIDVRASGRECHRGLSRVVAIRVVSMRHCPSVRSMTRAWSLAWVVALMISAPALAQSELEALKQQVEEQRRILDRQQKMLEEQQKVIERLQQ